MGKLRKVAEFYKALADETRLTILQLLSVQEMCACEIIAELGMSQPTVSHHLKILRQAELVIDNRDGKWIYYTLNDSVFMSIFPSGDLDVLKSYSEPILRKSAGIRPSKMRDEASLCSLKVPE